MKSPLYVAIDTPDLAKAQHLAGQVRHHVGGLKLGLEFFCANGHHGVHEMMKFGLPIFLDLKLHDIPNTVAKAVQALHLLEPAILTVHAAGGRAMLEDAKAAAGVNTKVVAVTVLTSLDDGDLLDIGVGGKAHDQVRRLADLAQSAGLDGIVCSGEEVAMARKAWGNTNRRLALSSSVRSIHWVAAVSAALSNSEIANRDSPHIRSDRIGFRL